MSRLPIEDVLETLRRTLSGHSNAVLVAPPGAGKTTRVPLALLNEPWLDGRKIIMLEPRRLAARSAARYMASLLGEQIGETVGYRVRLDNRVGPKTRIEVVTEGILTRLVQNDPTLEGIGAVIFDEFHERSMQADLGLALCLEVQRALRFDLRLLAMSATLDAKSVAELMRDAPVIISEGRSFPVETIYLSRPAGENLEQVVVKTIGEAVAQYSGDILVFLPGIGEIRRVERRLKERGVTDNLKIRPLFGSMPLEDQDLAIASSLPGERKIVLATAIAETSLTVEGITVVIDSGLMRVPRFSPRTGMTRLDTIPVARAAAEQRRGRAGRLKPGVCYRLWTENENLKLLENRPPEILEADLAPLCIELAAWGAAKPSELSWLNPPPEGTVNQAWELLRKLEALNADGKITKHGRQMVECGIHPRLAHMIIKAIPLGLGNLACELAAVLGGHDLLAGVTNDADIRLRIDVLRRKSGFGSTMSALLDKLYAEANHLKRMFTLSDEHSPNDLESCGLLLSFAYPDRIAQRRDNGKFLLQNSRGAFLPNGQPLANEPYLVACALSDDGTDSRIFLAAPLVIEEIYAYFSEIIETQAEIVWDSAMKAVRARKYDKLGGLVIKEEPLRDADPEMVLKAMLAGIKAEGFEKLPWTRSARRLQQRVVFMHNQEGNGWPDMADSVLQETLDVWLAPYLYGISSLAGLQRINLVQILESMLSWQQLQRLDKDAPTHITAPSGRQIPIDYANPDAPVLAVRLQEMFGLRETPRIAGGNVVLTLHLLSPALRPVQVTKDLASFWQDAYFEVKKDLAGRYPKHYWPDNPLAALPTSKVKAKMLKQN